MAVSIAAHITFVEFYKVFKLQKNSRNVHQILRTRCQHYTSHNEMGRIQLLPLYVMLYVIVVKCEIITHKQKCEF